MTHLWVRAEQRDNETRVGLTPSGVRKLLEAGMTVTVENSPDRCIPTQDYAQAGATIVSKGRWPEAPSDAIILGLKELPDTDAPLHHRHIFFGHAYKGQPAGQRLLQRFRAGGGALYDLEYLVDAQGRRVAAFGYWAGFAGAAVALKCWVAQQQNQLCGSVSNYRSSQHLQAELQSDLLAVTAGRPTAIIIGALGRVGSGAADLCRSMGVAVTAWDMEDTQHRTEFPEILDHNLFLNCILARPGVPVFIPNNAKTTPRRLSVIADIACDPDSDFSPIKVYDQVTTWQIPALRVHDTPPLDVTAIDNLPSLLPRESSEDFASQLLDTLLGLADLTSGPLAKANADFETALKAL